MTVLEDILSQEIIQKLGWTLLHFIWQAAAVAFILTILLRLLRKSTANLRYIIACLALLMIVLLPVITIRLVPVSVIRSTAFQAVNTGRMPVPPSAVEMSEPETIVIEKPAQSEIVTPAPSIPFKQRAIETLEPALPYIVSGWLIGVFALSIWHLGGWAQLQRLKRRMVKQVDNTLRSKLKVLAQRLRVKQTVQLMESALVQIPTVVGWLRPVILLPASALTGLSSEQLEAILAHELAHIRRHDYLVNILQTVVDILGFYHPAVWWVSHKIRAERENCCDDLAVSISGDRVCYAGALTSMEEIRSQRDLAVAATGGNLSRRICRLVSKDSTEKTRFSWIPAVTVILLILALVIPTTLALTTHNRIEDPAKSLLDKMLEHRSKVKNVQFVAEYDIWHAGYSEEYVENIRKSMRERGIPEQQLQRMTRGFSLVPQSRYQILKCTIDNEERAKIERTTGTYDSSGKKLPSGDKNISAWNGVLGTDFNQRRGFPGNATFKDTPPTGASRQGHPWKTFTGNFCRQLTEAINAERQISVDESKDGTYRVVFDNDPIITIAVIDPSQGYSCILNENYNKEKLAYRSTPKYKEVAKGIWFPVSGQTESYIPPGSLLSKSIIETSQIKINDPDFNKSFFDVELPEGTEVRDTVQGKHYVVGSKNLYELDEPQKPSAETEEVDPNSWQQKFYSIYSLEDGELLKRIAPPFIPERRNFFLNQPGRHSSNANYHMAIQYTFNWDGELKEKSARIGSGIPRLNSILESVIGLGKFEYDIPIELLQIDMSGDWIVRKDTPTEALMKDLKEIVKNEAAREIDFVKKKVETEVIIAKGKYDFKPLPGVKEGNYILICTDKMDTYIGGGGGSGTVSKFLRWVGNRINMYIIDETESEDIKIYWRNHDSSNLRRLSHNKELYSERLDMLLSNLTRQTGLTFERKTAAVEKWFIAEEGAINTPQKTEPDPAENVQDSDSQVEDDILLATEQEKELSANRLHVPVPAKSPAPSAQDKTIIQVDCLVVEVFTDLKMDRETTVVAENILEKVTTVPRGQGFISLSTTATRLLREAAEATAPKEDGSAGDKRVTQDQFKALVEMLASRGLMKILMNPRIQVVDGKTAKIKIAQGSLQESSLQITPHVSADGHIILEVKAVLGSQGISESEEQTPFSLRELYTRVRVSLGESLIIGGLKENQSAPEKQAKEVLFILTPTIIKTDNDSEKKAESAHKLKLLGLAVVMYADDHDDIMPHTLQELKPYIQEEQDFAWLRDNVEYFDKGKTAQRNAAFIPIAYDKTLLEKADGTNVLFLDFSVRFVDIKEFEKLDITKAATAVTKPDESAEPNEPMETVNLNNVEMKTIVETLAEWTGKVIIPNDDLLRQKITIYAPVKLSRSKAVAVIYSALRFIGYTAEETGETILLKPEKETKPAEVPTISDDDSLEMVENKDQVVQKFFKLKHYSPSQMAQILKPLLSHTGHISTYERTNSLLVIDTAESLLRIQKIIAAFDVSETKPTVTEIFEIRYGDPAEIVGLLKKLINGRPDNGAIIEQGKEPIVLIPEPRRKWIIARASPENMKQIGQWIEKLDIKKNIGMDPIDVAVYEQLEKIVDLSDLAPGMSFGEVVEKLENSVQPPLQIQPIWKDLLENAEVERATPAGMDPLTGIKLRKALEILLTSVSSTGLPKLTYVVDKGVILIGTVDMLSSRDDLPEPNLPLAPKVPLISSTFIDCDLPMVLKTIASMAGVPIIPDEKVIGLVNAELKDVPLDTALEIVLAGTPYVVKKTPYYYLVGSPENMLKIAEQIKEWDVPLNVDKVKPRIINLRNSDAAQMAKLLRTLFTKEGWGGLNIQDILIDRGTEIKQKIVGPLYGQLTFEEVPGTKKIIVISRIPEAYDVIEEFIFDLDRQEMTPEDMKQIGEWIKKPDREEPIPASLLKAEKLKGLFETGKRVESAKKLSNLGKSLLIYANDHDDKYPDSMHEMRGYLRTEDFAWTWQNVEYLAHGKTIAVRPDIIIAYDKKLLTKEKGTNVLFNDSHVEFVKPERLKELGISATEILIETRLLMVSEDFLKDIGLDTNSVHSSDAWSEHLLADPAAEPNAETYSLILDDLHISFLHKAVQAHKGTKAITAPRIMVHEGKTAEINIMTEEYYVLGYTEPNDPSDKPEPKIEEKVEIGTRIWLKPELTPDNENVNLDFKLEILQLLGFEERKYKGKYPYHKPIVDVIGTEKRTVVPDGATLLIGGLKITEQAEIQSSVPILSKLPLVGKSFRSRSTIKDQKMLLILVKPVINPQQKARKILPGQADSEEHIKSLGRLLEKKLNPPDEPK